MCLADMELAAATSCQPHPSYATKILIPGELVATLPYLERRAAIGFDLPSSSRLTAKINKTTSRSLRFSDSQILRFSDSQILRFSDAHIIIIQQSTVSPAANYNKLPLVPI